MPVTIKIPGTSAVVTGRHHAERGVLRQRNILNLLELYFELFGLQARAYS
jgi:hypothetical protein